MDQTHAVHGWVTWSVAPGDRLEGMTLDHAGTAVWIKDPITVSIIRTDASESNTSFPLNSGWEVYGGYDSITRNPDGNIYFLEDSSSQNLLGVGQLRPSGLITDFSLPPNVVPYSIVTGGDGNLWMPLTGDNMGRLTPQGTLTLFPISSAPDGPIMRGRDGTLWWSGYPNPGVTINNTSLGGVTSSYATDGIFQTVDSHGILWGKPAWRAQAGYLMRFDPATGLTSQIQLGSGNCYYPDQVISGDGSRLYIMSACLTPYLITFDVKKGQILSRSRIPTIKDQTFPVQIAIGPDANVWTIDTAGNVMVHIERLIAVKPNPISVLVGQTTTIAITEQLYSKQMWIATIADPSIATVAPGSDASHFVVTGLKAGTTTLTVTDDAQNSLDVDVTVH